MIKYNIIIIKYKNIKIRINNNNKLLKTYKTIYKKILKIL